MIERLASPTAARVGARRRRPRHLRRVFTGGDVTVAAFILAVIGTVTEAVSLTWNILTFLWQGAGRHLRPPSAVQRTSDVQMLLIAAARIPRHDNGYRAGQPCADPEQPAAVAAAARQASRPRN